MSFAPSPSSASPGTTAPAASRYQPPAPVAAPIVPLQLPPAPAHPHRSTLVWLFGVLTFVLVALVGYFLTALGGAASAVGLVLALVPLTIVFVGIHLIDRWEPEPRGLIAFALAWGAIAAVGLTLLVDLALTRVLGLRPDAVTTVIQAPIVEEITKGLGVLLIFITARRAFDGPVDGVVYGALVGAGFAFTENVQYFAVSLIEGGGADLTATFLVRGFLSPFAHVMFTAVTGFAVGLVARRGGSAGAAWRAACVGGLGAILLHGFWNWSAVFANFFELYVTLQVPLFVGFILGIVALRREEARLTFRRLGEYADAGWFTPQEVTMLATTGGRKQGLAWAKGLRGNRRELMKSFIKDATTLAAVRQRALAGRDRHAAEHERALLARTAATRQALLAY